MKVQTRSHDGSVCEFDSLDLALSHAMRTKDVWKISFSLETGERVRMVYENGWIMENIQGNRFQYSTPTLVKHES